MLFILYLHFAYQPKLRLNSEDSLSKVKNNICTILHTYYEKLGTIQMYTLCWKTKAGISKINMYYKATEIKGVALLQE